MKRLLMDSFAILLILVGMGFGWYTLIHVKDVALKLRLLKILGQVLIVVIVFLCILVAATIYDHAL